jgi:hypothetical protein
MQTDTHDCLLRPECRTCTPSDACFRCGYSPAVHTQRINDIRKQGLRKDGETGLWHLQIRRKRATAGATTTTTAD